MHTYHIYQDTPEGRLPFTYMVFGPYADGFDVEVHKGHVNDNHDFDAYLFTDTIQRDTHVIADMRPIINAWFAGYCMEV